MDTPEAASATTRQELRRRLIRLMYDADTATLEAMAERLADLAGKHASQPARADALSPQDTPGVPPRRCLT